MAIEIKSDTPISVLLHLHPESEAILQKHFKNRNFTNIAERVKTLQDLSNEESVDIDLILNDLRKIADV